MDGPELATTLAVHEAVCAERWLGSKPTPGSAASRWCSPLSCWCCTSVGDGSVVGLLRRLLGGG
jgi:hypothetical protein